MSRRRSPYIPAAQLDEQTELIRRLLPLFDKDGAESVPPYDVHRPVPYHCLQQEHLERRRAKLGLESVGLDIGDGKLEDPETQRLIHQQLTDRIDAALQAIEDGELGPVQYEKWMQVMVVLVRVIWRYWAWDDDPDVAYECHVYCLMRADQQKARAGMRHRLEWPEEGRPAIVKRQ